MLLESIWNLALCKFHSGDLTSVHTRTHPHKQLGVFQARSYVHENTAAPALRFPNSVREKLREGGFPAWSSLERKEGQSTQSGKIPLISVCVPLEQTPCSLPRTIESLYKELVEEGLLIRALKVNLSDYIAHCSQHPDKSCLVIWSKKRIHQTRTQAPLLTLGFPGSSDQHCFPFIFPLFLFSPGDYSYLGTTLRQVSIEPMPSLLDVRQLITLYGIWPLGKDSACTDVPFPSRLAPLAAVDSVLLFVT
ncbi:hypothetical protein P7K49_013377 [Saguinus oedipus]|uniref:Uncharacterized protein n=1 Tax=Saguinus oedipus TaxID=9490 RepID=A0ABQ9VFR7_SAGOE|nr:hypothetical protein P7K49_013377 [Saguinus oedipus]